MTTQKCPGNTECMLCARGEFPLLFYLLLLHWEDLPKVSKHSSSCVFMAGSGMACNVKRKTQRSPTLILNARLKPLAKNPPNGPITEAKLDMAMEWSRNGYRWMVLQGMKNWWTNRQGEVTHLIHVISHIQEYYTLAQVDNLAHELVSVGK